MLTLGGLAATQWLKLFRIRIMSDSLAEAMVADPAIPAESIECFKELARWALETLRADEHLLCRAAWEVAAVACALASLSKQTGRPVASFDDLTLGEVAPMAGQGAGDILALAGTEVGAVKEREMKLVFGMLLSHLIGPDKENYKDHQLWLSRLKDDLEMLFVDLTGRALISTVQTELSLN